MKKSVPEILVEGATTYRTRNKKYADNYKRIGKIMTIIFPDGLPKMNIEDWNRFGVWFMHLNKSVRYAMQLQKGGHKDTAHDMMVYGAMLEELTDE
jgi:hypothetical protein